MVFDDIVVDLGCVVGLQVFGYSGVVFYIDIVVGFSDFDFEFCFDGQIGSGVVVVVVGVFGDIQQVWFFV